MCLTRRRWLILFLAVLSGAFTPRKVGAVSPDDVWTEEKKKALVWLKIMLDGDKPSYGTGFLVQGGREQLYVLTATHVVEGNIEPKDYNRGNWYLKQGSELRLGLGGGELLASDDVINLFNGNKPLEVSAIRLRPRSPLFSLPISFAPIGNGDILSLAGFPNGNGTPEIRSGKVKTLVSQREVPNNDITYKADMMVVDIDTVDGQSGSPYLNHNGGAVGLHFGAVMNRGGHAHMIPFASISRALDDLEIGPTPRNGGQPLKACSVNSLGMEFVEIPAGIFSMGSQHIRERPIHQVEIMEPFCLGKYEVTQRQWLAIMGSNPSYFKGDNLPVEQVSWNEVQEFIQILNKKEKGDTYRLPTEAEWEYAARSEADQSAAMDKSAERSYNYAWCSQNSAARSHPIGQTQKNSFGLYDMYGNVNEWVYDWFQLSYVPEAVLNFGALGRGRLRVIRGGSWKDNANDCTPTARRGRRSYSKSYDIGFRLVLLKRYKD